MTTPNANGQRRRFAITPAAEPADTGYCLTPEQARVAEDAILRELHSMLEDAAGKIHELSESGEGLEAGKPTGPDSRAMFDWIAESVDTLDALGWERG